ncbi:MAG: energy-coupling factor transporter transmembrane protein EcfT [Ruminococcaceae bacterium]|nr:energy-coupling factor transporter transmembrane protein EcfT [Oscillospiraceae bacterium]
MKISIGQYVPGNSVFHRADPRTKILWTIAMMVLLLIINSFVGYAIAAVFVIVALIISRINIGLILKSLKTVTFLIVFTMILNLLFYKGETVLFTLWKFDIYLEGVMFSLKMIIRIILLISATSLLTFTTTSVMLTDGLERLLKPLTVFGFPAHDVSMMMSIALRFIPTFSEETDRIIKAQSSRGADFDSPNLYEKIKSFVSILIPLFIGAFRRAEELATAMEAKCYRGGEGRTRLRVLKFSSADVVILIYSIIFLIFVIFEKIGWQWL